MQIAIKASGKLESIQVLRAIAALVVVVHHTGLALIEYYPYAFSEIGRKFVMLGAAGVDQFFVISGYIIYKSTAKLSGAPGDVRLFLLKRFLRIYPNYWIWTTVILCGWLIGAVLRSHDFKCDFILRSYLLLPMIKPDGSLQHPLLDQGWTLSFEIYFYLVFAVLIALRWNKRNPLFMLIPFIVLAAFTRIPHFPQSLQVVITSPLIMEFLLGVCVGWLINSMYPSKLFKINIVFFTVLAWAIALFYVNIKNIGIDRLIVYGIPSALTLLTFLLFSLPAKLNWLAWFGDASYSIYLVHGLFTLSLGAFLKSRQWTDVHLFHPEIIAIFCACIFFVIGSLAYKFIELPTMLRLNRYVFRR